MSEYVTEWPPMMDAMRRTTARKCAIAGVDASDEEIRVLGPKETMDVVRAMLSGTDVPVKAMGAMAGAIRRQTHAGLESGATLDQCINGAVLDCFLLGFWTREAMP